MILSLLCKSVFLFLSFQSFRLSFPLSSFLLPLHHSKDALAKSDLTIPFCFYQLDQLTLCVSSAKLSPPFWLPLNQLTLPFSFPFSDLWVFIHSWFCLSFIQGCLFWLVDSHVLLLRFEFFDFMFWVCCDCFLYGLCVCVFSLLFCFYFLLSLRFQYDLHVPWFNLIYGIFIPTYFYPPFFSIVI